MEKYFPQRLLRAISIGFGVSKNVSKQGQIGQVYSIFERAFHIVSPLGEVTSVVRKDVLNGPLNIVIDLPSDVSMSSLGMRKGNKVVRVGDMILIGDGAIAISLGDAEIWSARRRMRRKILGIEDIKNNLSIVKQITIDNGQHDGLGRLLDRVENIALGESLSNHDLNLFAQAALPNIYKLIKAVRERKINNVKRSVENLVGLGPGLTPSTDDMLVGFMTGMIFMSEYLIGDYNHVSEVNKAIIAAIDGKTTMLSQEFMKYAAIGEVAEPIRNLVEAIFMGSRDEVAVNTSRVLTVGETSGTDALFGVILGMYLKLGETDFS